ncbi:branched-chain amino acid transport, periplasmic component 1 [Thermoproteus uzoniensis 768-20]|uniref:Branched-chain amino acid transport, periplasmic component 1 n=1 Tax=Thermoproteus uzoniensis (strain 768-20) TaxID=999630 RepID=F2L1J2_THEU7|nr:branched-chain amino acid transport, periplasmic component 1 [Thermoproteus uzoniensis 768-20]
MIVIGTPAAISGRYSTEGQYILWGAMAAVNWINDHGGINCGGKMVKVRLIYRDSQSNAQLAASIAESLITQDHVNFLLSPYGSDLAIAVSPVAEKYGVLMAVVGASSDRIFQQGFKYVIGVASPASHYFWSVLDMVRSIDPSAKTVAILYSDDEFDRYVASGAKTHAQQLGFQVVVYDPYPPTTQDVTSQVLDVKNAHPDIILVAAHYADGQLVTQTLYQQNVTAKLIALTVAPLVPDYYKALGTLAECIVGPSHWEPGVNYSPELAKQKGIDWFGPTRDEFINYFEQVAKQMSGKTVEPGYEAGWAAEGVLVLLYGVQKAGSVDPNLVRQALANSDFMTFFGEFKMNATNGLNVAHSMVVTQWQGGQRVVIWPSSAAQSKPFYPSLTWSQKAAGQLCKP